MADSCDVNFLQTNVDTQGYHLRVVFCLPLLKQQIYLNLYRDFARKDIYQSILIFLFFILVYRPIRIRNQIPIITLSYADM